jgi:hypothetical protein
MHYVTSVTCLKTPQVYLYRTGPPSHRFAREDTTNTFLASFMYRDYGRAGSYDFLFPEQLSQTSGSEFTLYITNPIHVLREGKPMSRIIHMLRSQR